MTETTYRIQVGSLENHFNSSNCLKIFQINARGRKPCASNACAVFHALFPCHAGHHNSAHSSYYVLTNLTSPSTSPLPGAIVSHSMTANGSPSSCPSRSSPDEPSRASFEEHKSHSICKIANISFKSTDDLQLSHVIFTQQASRRAVGFLGNDDPKTPSWMWT